MLVHAAWPAFTISIIHGIQSKAQIYNDPSIDSYDQSDGTDRNFPPCPYAYGAFGGGKVVYHSDRKAPLPVKGTIPRVATEVVFPAEADREPIKAFLRIRPDIGGDGSERTPYLESISDTAVRMIDPARDDPRGHSSIPRFRLSAAPISSIYTFTYVFPPTAQQPEFFAKTTLPLVRGLLDGEDGLLFAYGVTNSGKTYTMQGGSQESSAGILPRAIDVLFNSIDGLQGNSKYRPARLNGIELSDASSIFSRGPSLDNFTLPTQQPVLSDVFAEHFGRTAASEVDHDPTTLKVDRNYEYSIWVSYAEVYNERIYDLLTNVEDEGSGPSRSQPITLTRKALSLKPAPPIDNLDVDGPVGKYISGLTHVRVDSAKEAKKLVKLGQLHRRVFGTLANSQSSRSHGIVTIKLLRKHRGEKDEPSSYVTSRLTLIDLAGSERSKNTQTSGERLKEAGNINKSLMVLGQCIEVMRANQKRIAQSLGTSESQRSDTRDVKKSLAVVPFRHSKLTEILMNYFTGEGRVTMIININPYDTGFDENSNVMKFAALAREVSTSAPTQRVPPPGRAKIPASGSTRRIGSHHRKVVLSASGRGGRKTSETQLDVVEGKDVFAQDEDIEDQTDEEPLNGLVEALFDEIERLRLQLFDSEMRSAVIEAETRKEVMREMEERIREMEKRFARRLMNEVELNETRMDAKIDMLHRSGLMGKTPSKVAHSPRKSGGRHDRVWNSEASRMSEGGVSSEGDHVNDTTALRSHSASPLAGRAKTLKKDIHVAVPAGHSYPGSHTEDQTMMEAIDPTSSPLSSLEEEESDEMEDEGSDIAKAESDEPDEWYPASSQPPSTMTITRNESLPHLQQAPSPIFEKDVKAGRARARPSVEKMSVSELADELGGLDLAIEKPRQRAIGRPTRQSTKMSAAEEEEDSIIIVQNVKGAGQKKKKR
ncbi:kinesin-domain-containing protein [Russula earlei]|uniref:Kinesin-domain-containing protein n=1 Tax=Russula earlei TaxID=71964 RepID=A0ACC0UJP5_9AGAM|nr:kinesin-domain-containing protein [Russula earlei]